MDGQDSKGRSSFRSKDGEQGGEEEEEGVGLPSVRITSEKEGSCCAA
jgi:hypothetical protein